MRIQITQNGPYIVTGNIPLREVIITPVSHHNELVDGKELPQSEEYNLCRCGHSQNAPFCDGRHATSHFNGEETASRKPYLDRITDVTEGQTMQLLDDGRCAYARFCHKDNGDIWTLTEQDQNLENRKEALSAAHQCPAGRLVMYDFDGNALEDANKPEILIVQDPAQRCSAGIFVKGPIVIESADGSEYEVRNRVALCRCGSSRNKPFCDASHAKDGYQDRSKTN